MRASPQAAACSCPRRLPQVTTDDLLALSRLPYFERAAWVYQAFGLDVGPARVRAIAAQAYGDNFGDPRVAPVRRVAPDRHVLELWHGPTLAFKDMALQCMPLFFSEALEQAHASGSTALDFLILVATSGDTGVAALNGFADRAHTRIVVYYPDDGVSAVQERQMITQPGDNLTVFRVAGDFDDCQGAVKAVFDDDAFAAELAATRHGLHSRRPTPSTGAGSCRRSSTTSAPTRTWPAAAVSHRASRWTCACPPATSATSWRPTTPSAWACRSAACCAPATATTCWPTSSPRASTTSPAARLVKTPSPSMDILVSSNLERLLYDLCGDAAHIRRLDAGPARTAGASRWTTPRWPSCAPSFRAPGWTTTPVCGPSARCTRRTATSWTRTRPWPGRSPRSSAATARCWSVSTAHWSKFAADVVRGLTGVAAGAPVGDGDELDLLDRVTQLAPGTAVPASLQAVRERPVRFDARVEGNREALEASLRDWLAARA